MTMNRKEKAMTASRISVTLTVFVLLAALSQACSDGSGGTDDAATDTNPGGFTCNDACTHMWWCGLIDLEYAQGGCTAACDAGTYGPGWKNCVRDTVGCPADFECTGTLPPQPKPVCENVCDLGYQCGFVSAMDLAACSTECQEIMNEIPAAVQDCLRSASTCVDLRHCICACDDDGTCNASCTCDPECGETCTCDATLDCDADCTCDPDCQGCTCDVSDGCDTGCSCDPDCPSCTCDISPGCDAGCACDPVCATLKGFGEACIDHPECRDEGYFPEEPRCVSGRCSRTCTFDSLCPTGTECVEIEFGNNVCDWL
jgi:hypothetical protein